ncbi:MAG: hypothetical protein GTN65_05705, partial [Armatimonadetes bacterium]|nr:hypothetical protein [Armatimonadota bacterium]NIO96588.1 hypothetical protein [Armatimonadota bacterium]
ACFGTPFFALFASITWYLAGRLVKTPNSSLVSSLFALSGLVMGLIRPEGVFLAFFMLFAVIYMAGIKHSGKAMTAFLCVFVILGGAYFLWRWNYFGHPLPNPFYKKGGGYLHWEGITDSVENTV